ncbi:MAG TPA: tripartite tricarboxylate transporter substrate-binding protein [Candidatus Eisenbacteria bacterium]|nr:tripartite tricarboxylate transporter substrate-binding protein [Candidatus Eisenbacteria bacterium]
MSMRSAIPLLLPVWLLSVIRPALSESHDSAFYHRKTIRIVVGSSRESLYDQWGRLLARYMGKYLPGRPNMIVQNLPGASGVVTANYGYTVAPPDGLTVMMFQKHIYLEQLIGRREVRFDVRRFHWIGSPDKGPVMLYIRADSPYKSIDTILKSADPPKCGAIGTSDLTYSMAKVMEIALGGSVGLVVGYGRGSEIDSAMERGEVVCRITSTAVHFSREPFRRWDKDGFDRHLLVFAKKRDTRLPDVPTIYELMEKANTPALNRQVAEVILAGNELGRPMVAPPGTALELVKLLREAYDKALVDPDLLAEVKALNLEVDPTTGAGLHNLVQRLTTQSPTVIARLKRLLEH